MAMSPGPPQAKGLPAAFSRASKPGSRRTGDGPGGGSLAGFSGPKKVMRKPTVAAAAAPTALQRQETFTVDDGLEAIAI